MAVAATGATAVHCCAGHYAPAPTERCDTVHAWLQHHIAERLQAARPGPQPALLTETYATLAAAISSYEQCRCARIVLRGIDSAIPPIVPQLFYLPLPPALYLIPHSHTLVSAAPEATVLPCTHSVLPSAAPGLCFTGALHCICLQAPASAPATAGG